MLRQRCIERKRKGNSDAVAAGRAGGGRAQLKPDRPYRQAGRHAGDQRTATAALQALSPEKLRA